MKELSETYYSINKEKILAKTRQKQMCECGSEVSYSNRKCHRQTVRHIIFMKSKESNEIRDKTKNI